MSFLISFLGYPQCMNENYHHENYEKKKVSLILIFIQTILTDLRNEFIFLSIVEHL